MNENFILYPLSFSLAENSSAAPQLYELQKLHISHCRRRADGKTQRLGSMLEPGDLSVLPKHSPFAGEGGFHENSRFNFTALAGRASSLAFSRHAAASRRFIDALA